MKNFCSIIFMGIVFFNGVALAFRGDVHVYNANHIMGIPDPLVYKLVIKDLNGITIKEIYRPGVPAKANSLIPQEELGIEQGRIDYYIDSLTNPTGFKECVMDLAYHKNYFTVIGGWDNGQKHYCQLMED